MQVPIVRIRPNTCIKCGAELDAATDALLEGALVSPGDVSVCLYCSNIMIFEEGFKLRYPTATEMVEVQRDPNIQRLIRIVEKQNAERDNRHTADGTTPGPGK